MIFVATASSYGGEATMFSCWVSECKNRMPNFTRFWPDVHHERLTRSSSALFAWKVLFQWLPRFSCVNFKVPVCSSWTKTLVFNTVNQKNNFSNRGNQWVHSEQIPVRDCVKATTCAIAHHSKQDLQITTWAVDFLANICVLLEIHFIKHCRFNVNFTVLSVKLIDLSYFK